MASSVFLDLEQGEGFTGQTIGPAADNTTAPPFSFLGDLTSGYGSSAVGTLSLVTAGSTRLSLSSTVATFASGVVGQFSQDAIAVTPTTTLRLANNTSATNAIPIQMSPRLELLGAAWNTTITQAVRFFIENLPANAATPTGTLKVGYQLAAGAVTYPLTIGSSGVVTSTGSFVSGNNYQLGASTTVSFCWGGSGGGLTRITCPADAQLNLNDTSTAKGIGLDFVTDGILKIRVRAQNAYATIDALQYNVSGVAGIDASITTGGLVGKTITVSKGIITGFV